MKQLPSSPDPSTSSLVNRYLLPGDMDRMTDAQLDCLLSEATPAPVDVVGLMAGIEKGSARSLPSGRPVSVSASKSQIIAKWAASFLLVFVVGLAMKYASSPAGQKATGSTVYDEWRVDFPPPVFVGTPALSVPGLTDQLGNPMNSRPPQLSLRLPDDARSNVALGKRVTSSAPLPVEGELLAATDGVRGSDATVTLEPGLQWLQLDLAASHEIFGVVVWHDYSTPTVYSDVVVAISDDPEFKTDVTVVFNNSRHGHPASGIRPGDDPVYLETNYGRVIETDGVAGRYVRLYSNGCSQDIANRYIEIETYGRIR